jgi:hypothetical protein
MVVFGCARGRAGQFSKGLTHESDGLIFQVTLPLFFFVTLLDPLPCDA